ncbi:MAG: CHASE4 domain-containing protein [Syntrophomonadaceae bacterium]|jgi:diguanylate cyclase (GGDEF)-like protein/PAS domain S-box-containing protein
MRIRNQFLVIISFLMVSLLLINYLISQYILMASYRELETQHTTENVTRALNALSSELSNLHAICRDWAWWDETCTFIQDGNQRYIEDSAKDLTFTNLRVDLVLYINPSGDLVYGKESKNKTLQSVSKIPAELSISRLTSAIAASSKSDEGVKGIIDLPQGLMLVSAVPILTSEGIGPSQGILVMGRFLNREEIQRLIQTTILSLSLQRIDPGAKDRIPAKADPDPFQSNIVIKPIDENTIAGYAYLKDIYGQQGLVMSVEMPRDIHKQGEKTVGYYYYVIVAVGILITLVAIAIIERKFLSRLFRVINGVSSIGAGGDHSQRLVVSGNDELTILSEEINRMLSNLESSQSQLRESEKQLRQITDEAVSADFLATPEGKLLMCNLAFVKMFGFSSREQALASNISKLFPHGRSFIKRLIECKEIKNSEFELLRYNGKSFIAEGNLMGRFDANGQLVQVQGYFFDITQRKQAEDEIRFLSFHDKLTGLYNRAFYDKELDRINSPENLPLTIMVADVNGLKLINDILGHAEGDKLLIRAAAILVANCRQQDIITRWGGDEFVVLFPKLDADEAAIIGENIKKDCQSTDFEPLQLSISLGFATKYNLEQNLNELFKMAEDRMYSSKFLTKRYSQNASILSLQKGFWLKGYESEQHAQRLETLMIKVAKAIGLPDYEMDHFTLIAVLHDIGKISIPKEIINKPGSLTPEEWEIVKKHPETGYRVARSSPELAPVGEAILFHHERWDGKGYPMGLKGEQIPLKSRILAVADAYDIMTNDCCYRQKVSHEQAIKELQRCSGTQFDPHIVDVFTSVVNGSEG